MVSIENETFTEGSDYNKHFKVCKFTNFKTKDYVQCTFENCTFPNNSELGLDIIRDINNNYINCDINIDGIIKKLFTITNGTQSVLNSMNAILNKTNTKNDPKQIVDIGKIKNAASKLAEI